MIPQSLSLAIPVVATSLAAALRDDRLPAWVNYVIIALFFVAAVYASVVVGGGITGDPSKDFYIIAGACLAVFAALETTMNKASGVIPSPLGALAAKTARQAEMQREMEAMWQASRAAVPPRASAPPNSTSTDKS